ncbi:hypothetical protein KSP40_PGU020494 [Platanthera guangdongensis]|uniref:Uncharacterized protein n=1 Tax=Platanthera guangdongensis TaxID=2320717 RepID=A0ABR2M3T3_9ASPA
MSQRSLLPHSSTIAFGPPLPIRLLRRSESQLQPVEFRKDVLLPLSSSLISCNLGVASERTKP